LVSAKIYEAYFQYCDIVRQLTKSEAGRLVLHHKADPRPQPSIERMKIMINDSAKDREETPHVSNSLRQRAQAVINDRSIDAQTRAVIRYGLEINDPWLAELVRGVDAGKTITDTIAVLANTCDDQ